MLKDSREFAMEIYAAAPPGEQARRDSELDGILGRIVRDPADELRGNDLNTLKKLLKSVESMPLSSFTKGSLEPLEASALSTVFKGAILTRIRNLES